jgi:hypothetical protein
MNGTSPTLGTILVLIGTILCGVAIFFGYTHEPRGRIFAGGTLVAIGAFLIGLGVLFGAPALVKVG